jgi:hypothetical protein
MTTLLTAYQMLTKIMSISPRSVLHITKLSVQLSIDKMLEDWHNDDRPNYPHIIVATTGALAVGLTLAEATEVILVEPNIRAAVEMQTFCRHCRQGNASSKVFSRLLYTPGHRHEENILMRNRSRKGLSKISIAAATEAMDEAE